MRSVREIITDFTEMGSQHYFQMHSGQVCEGWIVSVEDDHVLFVDCNPLAEKEETKVRFGAIALGSLAYRDDDQKAWIRVRWDDEAAKWSQTGMSRDEPPVEVVEPVQTSFWNKFKRPKASADAPPAVPHSKPSINS